MEMLWTWLLSFFFILALLCILGYQLVCLVDLEHDYINPYDSSSRINSVILPEFIVQGVLCFILLIARHWFMLFMALPHLYYNVNLYMTRRHLVDVTEIYNQLSWEKKLRFFKNGQIGHIHYFFILVAMEHWRRIRLTRHHCSHQALPIVFMMEPETDTRGYKIMTCA